MRTRFRSILINLTVLAGACTLALLGAEIAVRVFSPHSRDHVAPSGLFRIDEKVGWALAPGKARTHESRYFETEYRSNRLGFRDPDRQISRSPGTYRVLLYGDSQVFGWGVPAEGRFSSLLENRLERTEVWNLAVPGYGLGQEVIAYETVGIDYEADEVCFLVSPSTLFRIPFDRIFRKPKPRFRFDSGGELRLDPVESESKALSGALYSLLSPFYLPYFVDQRLQALQMKNAPKPQGAAPGPPAPPPFDELAESILLRAKATAEARGQRICILAELPDAASMARAREFAAEELIPILEIHIDRSNEEFIFGPHDRHWNLHANEAIADQLYPRFGADGRLSPPAGLVESATAKATPGD